MTPRNAAKFVSAANGDKVVTLVFSSQPQASLKLRKAVANNNDGVINGRVVISSHEVRLVDRRTRQDPIHKLPQGICTKEWLDSRWSYIFVLVISGCSGLVFQDPVSAQSSLRDTKLNLFVHLKSDICSGICIYSIIHWNVCSIQCIHACRSDCISHLVQWLEPDCRVWINADRAFRGHFC